MNDVPPPPKSAIVEVYKPHEHDIRERINSIRLSFAKASCSASQNVPTVQSTVDFNQALPFQNFNQFSNFNDFSNFNQFSNFNNFNNS